MMENKTKIDLKNKSIFITGAAGFIGSNLAKRLLSTVEGVKVVGLDNMNHYYDVRLKEARLNELEKFENFSFVKGNLADKSVIEAIFEQYKPEIVVNLGAQAGVRYSITNPDAYVEANLIGFYNILEACRHSYDEGHTPVEHLVYVYRKIQGHLIIEFPEMVAILNAKNVEDTKSFMSRQKDTYKTPYDRHPKDHKRQCVFAGSSNSLDFLPMDRSGNRRFLPILCNMEEAETHILDDEKTSREYIDQMWAEAMEIYRSGKCQLRLPKEMEKELCEYQKQFMQEDTKKELILDYLEHYEGSMVCSRQLYSEALGNDGNPAQWEIREINDIMNNCSDWIAFSNPRHFPEPYRRQKGWEKPDNRGQDFQPITKEQMEQLSLPPEWMER